MTPDLTFEETLQLLAVSRSHLRNLVRDNLIPHYRAGDLVRFEPARLDAWKAAGGTEALRRNRQAAGQRRRAAHARPATVTERRPVRQALAPAHGHGSMAAWAHLISADEGER